MAQRPSHLKEVAFWSTPVATLLANLDQIEQHRAGDDPTTLPFYPCGQHAHA